MPNVQCRRGITGLRRGYRCITPTSNSTAAFTKISFAKRLAFHSLLASMLLSGAIKDGGTVRVTVPACL